MHAQCQDIPDATYAFLSENEDSSIKWYCSHCKVIATGVVTEVGKIAKSYKEMDRRVKKLETQIKSKANEADLEQLWRELHTNREGKVTQETLTDMHQNLRDETQEAVKQAIQELADTVPNTESVRKLIQNELETRGDQESAASAQGNTPKEGNGIPLEETVVELSKEVMDQNNRRNNIIIHRLSEKLDTAYTSQGNSRNEGETTQVLDLVKTVMGKDMPGAITKCTRLGKTSPEKPRPLLVMFKDSATKDNFMDNLKQLKGSNHQHVSIAHDLTTAQREELTKLVAEAKAKEEQESGDWEYRVVGHPSRWQIKRKKKKQALSKDQSSPPWKKTSHSLRRWAPQGANRWDCQWPECCK